jgi:class 3 adenylate cyclase
MTTDNKVVMFVDILGFAALTESYPIDVNLIKIRDRLFSPSLTEDTILELSRNRLADTFSGFHSSLRDVLSRANMRHSLTSITFSDSVFVATTYAFEAVNIAVELLHTLLPQKIPIRIGIAYGSFAAVRFSSNITSDSGDHAVQFLGTAVVRAHATETCGIKGLRILLHPSVISLLGDIHHNPVSPENSHSIRQLQCSEHERINKSGIQHEIDYWHLKPTRESEAWHGLQDMWNEAPLSEVKHYIATAEAINRMRIFHGHKPLKNLRRRTLPR